ncbi:hypothetical protein Tco_1076636 [Tanacetum coccineum]
MIDEGEPTGSTALEATIATGTGETVRGVIKEAQGGDTGLGDERSMTEVSVKEQMKKLDHGLVSSLSSPVFSILLSKYVYISSHQLISLAELLLSRCSWSLAFQNWLKPRSGRHLGNVGVISVIQDQRHALHLQLGKLLKELFRLSDSGIRSVHRRDYISIFLVSVIFPYRRGKSWILDLCHCALKRALFDQILQDQLYQMTDEVMCRSRTLRRGHLQVIVSDIRSTVVGTWDLIEAQHQRVISLALLLTFSYSNLATLRLKGDANGVISGSDVMIVVDSVLIGFCVSKRHMYIVQSLIQFWSSCMGSGSGPDTILAMIAWNFYCNSSSSGFDSSATSVDLREGFPFQSVTVLSNEGSVHLIL